MTAKFFVDTNVLVYAASAAAEDQPKRDIALELLDQADLALSGQVLAEFYVAATAKKKLNLTHDETVIRPRLVVDYFDGNVPPTAVGGNVTTGDSTAFSIDVHCLA